MSSRCEYQGKCSYENEDCKSLSMITLCRERLRRLRAT